MSAVEEVVSISWSDQSLDASTYASEFGTQSTETDVSDEFSNYPTCFRASIPGRRRLIDALSVLRRLRQSEDNWIFISASSDEPPPVMASIIRAHTSYLAEALDDLDEVIQESQEDGFPAPSELAIQNANRLIREMYLILSMRFEVYPMPDGEIAISAPGGRGQSVITVCDSAGGVLCSVNMNGAHRRARYSGASSLPDGFLREALAELASQDI